PEPEPEPEPEAPVAQAPAVAVPSARVSEESAVTDLAPAAAESGASPSPGEAVRTANGSARPVPAGGGAGNELLPQGVDAVAALGQVIAAIDETVAAITASVAAAPVDAPRTVGSVAAPAPAPALETETVPAAAAESDPEPAAETGQMPDADESPASSGSTVTSPVRRTWWRRLFVRGTSGA
ncbi:hypothetical protein UG55_10181, partial [Frankia sp. EI5c]